MVSKCHMSSKLCQYTHSGLYLRALIYEQTPCESSILIQNTMWFGWPAWTTFALVCQCFDHGDTSRQNITMRRESGRHLEGRHWVEVHQVIQAGLALRNMLLPSPPAALSSNMILRMKPVSWFPLQTHSPDLLALTSRIMPAQSNLFEKRAELWFTSTKKFASVIIDSRPMSSLPFIFSSTWKFWVVQ